MMIHNRTRLTTRLPIPRLKSILGFFTLEKLGLRPPAADLGLAEFQALFNERMNAYLDGKLESYRQYSDNAVVSEAIEYAASLVRSGGKRIRPYIAFVAYANEGGADREEAIRAGIALELFHAFALVHDDLIDRGTERHGKPTTHVHVKDFIRDFPRGDKAHLASGMTMLAGDLILSWSHEVIASLRNEMVQELFFRMIEEVVAGQMLDVSFMLQYEVESKSITKKNELKTALYSFVNPMLVGSALAYRTENDDTYRRLGLALGQAYQIQDDLLDIVGDPSRTGKANLLDVQDGQHTILSQYVFENSEASDREVFLSLFGKTVDEHSKKVLLRLFRDVGAIEYAEREISRLFGEARKIVSDSGAKASTMRTWNGLIEYLDKRKS